MTQIKNELNRNGNKRGMNPNSRKNLRNDASPGRPHKADCLLDCIKDELSKVSLNGIDTNEQIIAGVLVSMATKGNVRAVELMMSYLHARPTQGIDINKDEGFVLRVIRESK